MSKIADGASKLFSQSRENLQKIQEDRAATLSVQQMSPKEQKAVAKRAQRISSR